MAVFFDTHAHLDYPDFAPDLEQVIERAAAAEIVRKSFRSGPTSKARMKRAIGLCGAISARGYAVVGWHQEIRCAGRAPEDIRGPLRELAAHPKVVALGETRDWITTDCRQARSRNAARRMTNITKKNHAALFRQHLEVAAELKLNCVIHQRDALEDTLAQLEPFAEQVRGVFHCFANDAETMKRIVAMNSLVSFTGIATFKNGQNVRESIAATPLDRLMLETDFAHIWRRCRIEGSAAVCGLCEGDFGSRGAGEAMLIGGFEVLRPARRLGNSFQNWLKDSARPRAQHFEYSSGLICRAAGRWNLAAAGDSRCPGPPSSLVLQPFSISVHPRRLPRYGAT